MKPLTQRMRNNSTGRRVADFDAAGIEDAITAGVDALRAEHDLAAERAAIDQVREDKAKREASPPTPA